MTQSPFPAALVRRLELQLKTARARRDHAAEVLLEQRIRELLREGTRP